MKCITLMAKLNTLGTLLSVLKRWKVEVLNIIVEMVILQFFFSRVKAKLDSWIYQHLFEIEYFCNNVKVFTVTSDQSIASLLNKAYISFKIFNGSVFEYTFYGFMLFCLAGLAHEVWIPPTPWSLDRSVTGLDRCHSSSEENAAVCWFEWHRSVRYEKPYVPHSFKSKPYFITLFYCAFVFTLTFLSQMKRLFNWCRHPGARFRMMMMTKPFRHRHYTVICKIKGWKEQLLPGQEEISTGG